MSFTTPLVLLLLLPAAAFVVWAAWPRLRAGRRAPRSAWASLLLRLLLVLLLVLAIAGAQWVRAVDDLSVLFLVDASDSISSEQAEQAVAFVREAIASMGPDDRAGVILFGRNALVEQPLRAFSEGEELVPFASLPQRLHTNLAAAIRLSLALFPSDSARRLVILSDGAPTIGDTEEATRLAAASGVSADVVYLPRPASGDDVLLTDVQAPGQAAQGETFRMQVSVESGVETDAALRVLAGGEVVYEEPVSLQPGPNRFIVRLEAGEPAFTRYQVQIAPLSAPAPAGDAFPQNNELAAFTDVTGPPRVLLVAGGLDDEGRPRPDEAIQLRAALEAAGLQVAQTTPAELSSSLADLAGYGSIVLVDVNAADLSPRKMEALRTYVRDLGGGLAAVGGPESYGMGGYFETPLEEMLPVRMQIDDEERFPSVSLALVMDRSGSMAAQEGGVLKIQLAAEGAVRALGLLKPNDELTVIPVDTAADQVIGPLTVADREGAAERIRQIGAGGGGIYVRTGLEAAAAALEGSDKPVKHIIVLADGADSEEKEGVPELIRELTAEGVTVSFVSIGQGPDVPWLQQMAEIGNGRFHLTDQAANLPAIFTQETAAIQRNYLIEERFFPNQASGSPILSGIGETPPLYGYVGTTAKDLAQVVLETPQEDPLLATWQYGLGRTLAWTSDATSRWAVEWASWDDFPRFWAQAVASTIGRVEDSPLQVSVTEEEGAARLVVDAQDAEGNFLTGLALTANVVGPDGQATAVALSPVAPGRYEGTFEPDSEGAYFIGVGAASAATTDGGPQTTEGGLAGCDPSSPYCLQTTAGWVLGYSPEYRQTETDPRLLAAIAAQTNGRELATDAAGALGPAAVFSHDLQAPPASRPIWPWLTLLAMLLLPFDVAVRRLAVTRGDLERAWATLPDRRRRQPAVAPARGEAMSQLFEAKERAAPRPAASPLPVAPPASPAPPEAPPAQAEAGEEAPQVEPPSRPAVDDKSPPGETLAARLRKRRQS